MRRLDGSEGLCRLDQSPHRQRLPGDGALDEAGGDAREAIGIAPVSAERELVEVVPQVFRLHRPRMRADQSALQQRDRPLAGLHGVSLALLGFRLHHRLM